VNSAIFAFHYLHDHNLVILERWLHGGGRRFRPPWFGGVGVPGGQHFSSFQSAKDFGNGCLVLAWFQSPKILQDLV